VRRSLPLIGLTGLLFAIVSTVLAQNAKDTPLAEKTRTVKLKAKITLSIKNEMLREVMKEISGAIEEKKAGALSFRPEGPVNMNARVTVDCKDKPVEEILDEMFKPLNYGYYVVSKNGDRDDGWIHITTNANERGTKDDGSGTKKETPKEEKKKEEKKEDLKKKEDSKKKDDSKDESAAAAKLNLIKNYIDGKKTDLAISKIEELLKAYPNTKAAEEAKALLEKLKK
jgi:hypothetical protein